MPSGFRSGNGGAIHDAGFAERFNREGRVLAPHPDGGNMGTYGCHAMEEILKEGRTFRRIDFDFADGGHTVPVIPSRRFEIAR